jgi:hypothetical protein
MTNKHLPKEGTADFGTAEHYYFEIESAIVARTKGDWDNPDLLEYGALNESEKVDIERIISTAALEEIDKNKLRVKYLAN